MSDQKPFALGKDREEVSPGTDREAYEPPAVRVVGKIDQFTGIAVGSGVITRG
jgi:hypothetical protein